MKISAVYLKNCRMPSILHGKYFKLGIPFMIIFSFYYCLPVESPTQTDICEINWKIFSFDDNTIVGEIAEIQIDFDQRSFHICLPFLSNIISTSTSHVSIFSFQFTMPQLLSTAWLVNFDVIINFFAIFFVLSISCSSYVLRNPKYSTNFNNFLGKSATTIGPKLNYCS